MAEARPGAPARVEPSYLQPPRRDFLLLWLFLLLQLFFDLFDLQPLLQWSAGTSSVNFMKQPPFASGLRQVLLFPTHPEGMLNGTRLSWGGHLGEWFTLPTRTTRTT